MRDVVPWVDAHLPTMPTLSGRVLAGLSADGYGAVDIGLRHRGLFGTLEAWSGYFTPFRDSAQAQAREEARRSGVGFTSEAPSNRSIGRTTFGASSGTSSTSRGGFGSSSRTFSGGG